MKIPDRSDSLVILVVELDEKDSYAAVGDTFTATNEGVEITYEILTGGIDHDTMQVGTGKDWDATVYKSVTIVKIPETVIFNEMTFMRPQSKTIRSGDARP